MRKTQRVGHPKLLGIEGCATRGKILESKMSACPSSNDLVSGGLEDGGAALVISDDAVELF